MPVRYFISPVIEKAFATYFSSLSLSYFIDENSVLPRIYKGIENRDAWDMEGQDSSITRLPCIICTCQDNEPFLTYAPGNWDSQVGIEIWGSADDMTDSEYAEMVEATLQAAIIDDLDAKLKAVDPELFFQKMILGKQSYRVQGRCWVTTQNILLRYSCGNSVPAS